jgi:hypothetical protein
VGSLGKHASHLGQADPDNGDLAVMELSRSGGRHDFIGADVDFWDF